MPAEERSCPLCGSSGARSPVEERQIGLFNSGFHILSCPKCAVRWLSPLPSPEQLSQLYEKTYFEPGSDNYSYAAQIHESRDCFRETSLTFQRRLGAGDRVLDIGCATGDFLEEVNRAGLSGIGIEPSSYAATEARKRGLRIIRGDLFTAELAPGSFGGIHMSHVLEHLPNIHETTAQVRALLRTDGWLYVEVPYQFDSLLDKANRILGRSRPELSTFSIHHCTFFTPKSLHALLERHGLEIVSSTTYLPCRRARRPNSLRKLALSSYLWLGSTLFGKGDVISVWARPRAS